MKKILLSLLILLSVKFTAQLNFTVTSPAVILNSYSPVIANITGGSNVVQVSGASVSNFCGGDLIMVYQAQGAGIDTVNTANYGSVTAYNSAGLYEFIRIQSVSGNIITTQSPFINSYAMNGRTQVISVPTFSLLTIDPAASIVAKDWKDTMINNNLYRFGGVVVLLAEQVINNGTITASGAGFRGGAVFLNSQASMGITGYVSQALAFGGEKGESIAGNRLEYAALNGAYGRGAAANGGGGGNDHNSAGGGGANAPNGNTWSGKGVMIADASNPLAAWALDPDYILNGNTLTNSSGGGRGGYSFGSVNGNAVLTGPNNPAWGGDSRANVGGLGGRPLTNIVVYATLQTPNERVYFGGGGGAGSANNNATTAGGRGGGLVYVMASASVTGSGIISADGFEGGSTFSCSCDGASGGGAGGSVVVKSPSISVTQTVTARGGKGGNELFIFPLYGNTYASTPDESDGPGGGGGGGFIAVPVNGVSAQADGGANGTSLSPAVTEMISNGATAGAGGKTVTVRPNLGGGGNIISITLTGNKALCEGQTLNLSTNATNPVYNWYGPNNFTASIQSPTLGNVTLAASGIYTMSFGGAACLSSGYAGTIAINVYPQPTVSILNITGSSSITCTTPTINLSAISNISPGGLDYFWSSSSFTASTQNITVTNPSTLITLSVSDTLTGCVASATTSIQINATPPVTSIAPINQFIGCGAGVVATATSVAITPSTNVTHNWYSPASGNPVSGGGQVSIYQLGILGASSTFTCVVVDNINGCSTSKTVQVTSTGGTYPTFSVTSVQNFSVGCSTRSLTNIIIVGAQAGNSGAVSYTVLAPGYSGGLAYTTGSTNIYNMSMPGTYTVIVRDPVNSCETQLPVSIIQNTFAPNISASAITRTLDCTTPSVVLTGTSTSTPVTYTWSFQNGVNPNSQVSNTIAINTTSAGATAPSATIINTYTLTIKDQNNFCTTNSVVTMYQNTRPPIPIIGGAIPLTCLVYSVNLSNMSSTGILPNTFLTGQSIGGILWQGPTPQQPKSNSSSYLGYTVGTYTLVAKDFNNGCTSQTTAVVGDNRVYPTLLTNTSVPLDCGASNTGGVKLGVTVAGIPSNSVTALWILPNTNPNVQGVGTLTLTTDGPGEYTVIVTTNSNQCASRKIIEVTNGILNADFTPDQSVGFAPLTVNFTNNSASTSSTSSTASITSVWSFGNGTTRTTTTNLPTSAVYTAPGNYTVTLFASKGSCLDTVVKVIAVDIGSKLEVPNVFTPNGDNSNDIFFIKAANLAEISAQIFDRWGNKVYDLSTDKGNIAWDGKNQSGKEVTDGTYFYTIRAKGRDGQSYDVKGTVTLLR